jgi:carbonic anhydrase
MKVANTLPLFAFALTAQAFPSPNPNFISNVKRASHAGASPIKALHSHSQSRRDPDGAGELPFGYSGVTGPLNWANLNANNTLCSTGQNQSPTNIATDESEWALTTQLNLIDSIKRKITYDGLTIELDEEPEGEERTQAVFNGELYTLAQWHHHTPSEHRINDMHYPMEIHFVFRTADTPPKSAVLGFVVELSNGPGDAVFQAIEPYLSSLGEIDSEAEIEALDYSGLRKAFVESTIFTYAGSLTTPPCSEGVSWYVVDKPLEISVDQYLAYKSILKFNSR